MKSIIDVAAKCLFIGLAVVMIYKLLDRDLMDQRIAVARQERMTQIEDTRKYLENRINRLQSDIDSYQIIVERTRRMNDDRLDMLSKQIKEQKTQQNIMLYNNGNGNSRVQ